MHSLITIFFPYNFSSHKALLNRGCGGAVVVSGYVQIMLLFLFASVAQTIPLALLYYTVGTRSLPPNSRRSDG